MNDNKNKYPIGELSQSASSSSQTVDELAEKKKSQKKSLIKIGTMGILTLILLIFSHIFYLSIERTNMLLLLLLANSLFHLL